MPRTGAPDDLHLLLVDGDNLLHAVRGSRDDLGVAWLLPRLARWRPPGLRIVVALDGHAAPGESPRGRVGSGIEFRHAGARSADDLIIELLVQQPFTERAGVGVVTRDHGLAERVRRGGGLTRSLDWLVARLEDPASSTRGGAAPVAAGNIGQGRPVSREAAPGREDEERTPWKPGRGATRKRGNPRRDAKATRRR
jgi:hypothetical protein